MDRYARQRRVGSDGPALDDALARCRVLVVGAGGTGAPLIQYLARAGVGSLTILDPDTVSVPDLSRQVLYEERDALRGSPKAECAARAVAGIGGRTQVHAEAIALHAGNAARRVSAVDFVFDATDHLPARSWIDDACRAEGRPWVHLAAIEDRWTVIPFLSADGPCFRCYLPEPPPPAILGTCETRGVLPLAPALAALHGASVLWGWLRGDEERPEGPATTERSTWIVRGRVGDPDVRRGRLVRDPACPACSSGATPDDHDLALRSICGKSRIEGWSRVPPEHWDAELRRRPEWSVERSGGVLRAHRDDETLTVFPDGRFVHGDAELALPRTERRIRELIGSWLERPPGKTLLEDAAGGDPR